MAFERSDEARVSPSRICSLVAREAETSLIPAFSFFFSSLFPLSVPLNGNTVVVAAVLPVACDAVALIMMDCVYECNSTVSILLL